MTQEEKKPFRINSGKLAALTLLLTVPVMMTGCNQLTASNECDPDYEECVYDDADGMYYGVISKKKYKSSSSSKFKSSSSKSQPFNGFGSGGDNSSGG
ncbi:hypothetical protein [Cohnella herbarum]|uniref:Lipoprotein n=1 Tax=Cohnella herbarum TaxID=2728023 RepID=A0A7Z2ZPI9_9BACL|nr:hypothetical protein [Cohnella herbarum]QJD87516.1 hypothetical protein HH215_32955 [Cohnella herbarum]